MAIQITAILLAVVMQVGLIAIIITWFQEMGDDQ